MEREEGKKEATKRKQKCFIYYVFRDMLWIEMLSFWQPDIELFQFSLTKAFCFAVDFAFSSCCCCCFYFCVNCRRKPARKTKSEANAKAKASIFALVLLLLLPMLLQSKFLSLSLSLPVRVWCIYSRSGICVKMCGHAHARVRVLIFSQKKIAIFKSSSFQPSIICKLLIRAHTHTHIQPR